MDINKIIKQRKEVQKDHNNNVLQAKIEIIDDNLQAIDSLKKEYFKDENLVELDKKRKKLIDDSNLIAHNLKDVKQTFKNKIALKRALSRNNKEIKRIEKYIKAKIKKQENKNKPKKAKIKKDFDFIWYILTGIFGFSTIGLLFSMLIFKSSDSLVWIGATFTFMLLFLFMFIFLIYLGKKTHAILEFKALMSGKPLCLFFTDHKRVDWKVHEPEAGIINDPAYGSFLVNEKGSYVDTKTRNVLMAFNPSVATNASMEAFNLSDGLAKVFKDEKSLSQIRYALANGDIDENDCVKIGKEKLEPFQKLRESIDFSPLKSLMNTILPHNINSKIEMQVAQRVGGIGKINPMQAAIIFVSIIGAVVLAVILLKMYGGGGGAQTVVRETVKIVAENATNTIRG